MKPLLILCLLVGSAAAQAPTDAERLYREGQAAYDAKNYDGALAAWTKSYELSKLPGLVFNIAQAHRLRGDCSEAVASYKKFILLDPSSSERPDAEGFIKDLEPKCPTKPVVPVKPVKPITGPTGPTGPVGGGDPHPGRGKRIAAYAVGGASLVAIGVGAVFGNKAKTLADEIETDCNDGCDWESIRDKDADGRAAERNQYILFGAGAAGLATAGILYWLGTKSSAVAVTPRGDGGATVSFTRAF